MKETENFSREKTADAVMDGSLSMPQPGNICKIAASRLTQARSIPRGDATLHRSLSLLAPAIETCCCGGTMFIDNSEIPKVFLVYADLINLAGIAQKRG